MKKMQKRDDRSVEIEMMMMTKNCLKKMMMIVVMLGCYAAVVDLTCGDDLLKKGHRSIFPSFEVAIR